MMTFVVHLPTSPQLGWLEGLQRISDDYLLTPQQLLMVGGIYSKFYDGTYRRPQLGWLSRFTANLW